MCREDVDFICDVLISSLNYSASVCTVPICLARYIFLVSDSVMIFSTFPRCFLRRLDFRIR